MRSVYQAVVVAALTIASSQLSSAAILLSVNPTPVTITAGTNSATFDIVVSPEAGEQFNSFTLAFGVGDGGTALGQPQDGDNLLITGFTAGSIFAGTVFSASISAGGIGQSAIQIVFARSGGNTAEIPANGVLASFTVDTTGTTAGQSFVLDPNIAGLGAAFDGTGAPIALSATNGSLQITAVPEPSSLGLLACVAGLASRRRRRS